MVKCPWCGKDIPIEEYSKHYEVCPEHHVSREGGILPRVKIGKKTYYIDERLGELRNVDNPNDRESIELAYAYRDKWF